MGVLAAHQENFDLADANFDLQVISMAGTFIGRSGLLSIVETRVPLVTCHIGVGALRLLYEFGDAGVAQSAFQAGPDVPSTALSPLHTVTRFTLVPAIAAVELLPVANGGSPDYRFMKATHDDRRAFAVIADGDFDDATPSDPLPGIRVWLEAMGGTVSVNIQ